MSGKDTKPRQVQSKNHLVPKASPKEILVSGKAIAMAASEKVTIRIDGTMARAPRQFCADGWMLQDMTCGVLIGFGQVGVFGDQGMQALVVAELTERAVRDFVSGIQDVLLAAQKVAERLGITEDGRLQPQVPKLPALRLSVSVIQVAHADDNSEIRLAFIPPFALTKQALEATKGKVEVQPLVDITMPTHALAGLLQALATKFPGE